MKFKDFKEKVESSWIIEDDGLRKGQLLMIVLNKSWYKEYVRTSSIDYYNERDIDCFYNDKLIPKTLAHLEKVWVNYPN